MSIQIGNQLMTLEQFCRMLNEGGGKNILFKKITITNAVKKIGEIGVKSFAGRFTIVRDGYKTEYEFTADDVEIVNFVE